MRIAQIDPMCETQYGHNISANVCFARRLTEAGFSVAIYAAKTLGNENSEACDFRRVFPSVVGAFQGAESTVACMSEVLLGIQENILFFPNVDRFMLEALARVGAALRGKRLLVRMIGVGESYFHGTDSRYNDGYTPNRFEHFDDLRRIAEQCDVRYCAESKIYQRLIKQKTGLPCDYWPAPQNPTLPVISSRKDVVYLPGTPRWDKGSGVADELTSAMAARNPDLTFAYQTDEAYARIDNNRVLLPRLLDVEAYWSWLARSVCVVLPYDADVYRYRGSASVFDALDAGAAVFTLDGVGFSEEVVQNEIGFVYEDLDVLKALDVRSECDKIRTENMVRFNALREEAFARQIHFLRASADLD